MSITTQDTHSEWFRILLFIILFFICIAFKPGESKDDIEVQKTEITDQYLASYQKTVS